MSLKSIKCSKAWEIIESRMEGTNIPDTFKKGLNQLKDAGYKIKLKDIVPKKDYNLLEKGLRMENMPFKKGDKQLQLNVPQDLSSLNIDTSATHFVIIKTDQA